MTAREIVVSAASLAQWRSHTVDWRRMPLALALLLVLGAPGALGEVAEAALLGAFVDVSVFVAATLFLFYGIEKLLRVDGTQLLFRHRVWQVPAAAALGAVPGCGGAIIVVSAYAAGRIGFGSVIAALTATMGDAAFLLLATRPDAAAVVIPVSLIVGVVSGWTANALIANPEKDRVRRTCRIPPAIGRLRLRDVLFLALAAPGLVMGILSLAQIEIAEVVGPAAEDLALAGVLAAVLIWAFSPVSVTTRPEEHLFTRVTEETSFVTIWVIAAFLLYDLSEAFLGLNLGSVTSAAAPLVPLLAILVGFVPGCGPQLVVTTLYINGAIPFAALIGNAISNDGDALFPALAIDRRAAILATLYSAVPAVIVAYACLLIGFEF